MNKIMAAYDYRDEAGELLYQNVRFDPKDFRQRRPNGKGGWIWDLNGVRRVPYRLPELLASSKQDWTVFVEGEKDIETLRTLGFEATTTGNANSWKPEFARYFAGRLVCLVPDHDKAGLSYAQAVIESLREVGSEVRLGEVPGGCKDITEYVESRDSADEEVLRADVLRMIDESKPCKATTKSELEITHEWVNGTEVKTEPVLWLWPTRVPVGEYTLIGGNSGAGKSFIALFIAATVTTGFAWPDSPDRCPEGCVLYLTDENSLPKVLVPRFVAMGGRLDRIRFHSRSFTVDKDGQRQETPFVFNRYRGEIEKQMKQMKDVRLIVVDPLVSYVDPQCKLNDTQDMSVEMGIFRQFAEEHSIAVLAVTTLNKRFDTPDISRTAGAYSIVYRSRAAHIVRYDPSDEESPKKRRQFLCQKIFAGETPQGLAFTLEQPGRVVFSQGTLTGYSEDGECSDRGRTPKYEKAVEFLQAELSNGPAEWRVLLSRAEDLKLSSTTLKRAATACGIVSKGIGFGQKKTAIWGLPGTDFTALVAKYGQEGPG